MVQTKQQKMFPSKSHWNQGTYLILSEEIITRAHNTVLPELVRQDLGLTVRFDNLMLFGVLQSRRYSHGHFRSMTKTVRPEKGKS